MIRTRLISIGVLIIALSLGTAAWALRGDQRSDCVSARVGFATTAPVAAIAGNHLVQLEQGRGLTAVSAANCLRALVAPTDAVLRHVDVRARVGTAYVLDKAGPDQLALLGGRGANLLQTDGEAIHPAWSSSGEVVWSEDYEMLKIVSPDLTQIDTIGLPRPGIGVFSPGFERDGDIVAVIQEPVRDVPEEDDGLNNLWRYSRESGRWVQLTDFEGTATDWSIIRTPLLQSDGSILFVRITGSVAATEPPQFELWRFAAGKASMVRALPDELFLAGRTHDGLLWNSLTDRCGDWGLFRSSGEGMEFLGCGAVNTEPVGAIDPDADEHGHEEGHDHEEMSLDPSSKTELVVVVGDFASRGTAEQAAAGIADSTDVVGHAEAPAVVRPGAWVVLVDTRGGSPQQALDLFRGRYPDLAEKAWLSPRP